MKSIIFQICLLFICISLISSYHKKTDISRVLKVSRALRGNYEKMGVSRYILFGYDIRKSDPLHEGLDQGVHDVAHNPAIFQLKAASWAVDLAAPDPPVGLTVLSRIHAQTTETSKDINKVSEFSSELSFGVTIDGSKIPHNPVAFSASASYKSLKSDSLTRGIKYVVRIEECVKFEVSMDPEKIKSQVTPAPTPNDDDISFTTQFITDVTALPTAYNAVNLVEKQKFKEFFSKYGTHYIRSLQIGGRKVTRTLAKSTAISSTRGSTITGAADVFGVGGNAAYTSTRKSSDGTNIGDLKEIVVGDSTCKEIGSIMPIKFDLIPILTLIQNKFGKTITGIDDHVLCQLEDGAECNPIDPVYAVTDIRYATSADSNVRAGQKPACDTGYEDFTKLVLSNVDMSPRVSFHTSKIANHKFLCQKKENIMNSDGSIKNFLVFNGPTTRPEVFTDKTHATGPGFSCMSKNNEVHDLNKHYSGRTRFMCWKVSNDRDQIPNAIIDFGIDGASTRNKFSTRCADGVTIDNKSYDLNADFDRYSCNCYDLNGVLGNFYSMCFTKTKKA